MTFARDVKLELGQIVPQTEHCRRAQLVGHAFRRRRLRDRVWWPLQRARVGQVAGHCQARPGAAQVVWRHGTAAHHERPAAGLALRGGARRRAARPAVAQRARRPLGRPASADERAAPAGGEALLPRSVLAWPFPRLWIHLRPGRRSARRVHRGGRGLRGADLRSSRAARAAVQVVARERNSACYSKRSQTTADLLAVLGAHTACLRWEEHAVLGDVRQSANRRANCDAANARRSAAAGERQAAAARRLLASPLWAKLPAAQRDVAELRIEYPYLSSPNWPNWRTRRSAGQRSTIGCVGSWRSPPNSTPERVRRAGVRQPARCCAPVGRSAHRDGRCSCPSRCRTSRRP